MTRITFYETEGFTGKGLVSGEIVQLAQIALARYVQNNSEYLTAVKSGKRENIIITDGNGNELSISPITLQQDLDEDFWIIIDNYGPNSVEGIRINFLLP
ncbi:hypothetical protein [Paenibacillus sp. URB8-2]|uniref:hypothetical protein n=1 Tax=Paenibacillus sp. URB8-2 TaxID=2741301 RepID=UPI0015BEA5FD|nr:hypothetical protein [Paenibacillus sp. URB8-2]BCG56749.1 hypothetical protein PUR_01740 [Paenibacillus sp. URB8-2]